MWTQKLNRREQPYLIRDEVIPLTNGSFFGYLAHDNVNIKTLELFTGPERSGEPVHNYTAEMREDAEWKVWLCVFAGGELVYASYETQGDTVEAEDVNLLHEEISEAQQKIQNQEEAFRTHEESQDNPHQVTKEQIGLSKVDNTSDEEKPLSKAQREALTQLGKQISDHTERSDNPHNVTKEQVGLSAVDNTSDADKPVSTAQREEINRVATEADTKIERLATERITAEAALLRKVEKEAEQRGMEDQALRSAIDEETANRKSTEAVLWSSLETETAAREDADEELRSSVEEEARLRERADAALQTDIDAEATARKNADAALQTNIDAEATTRESEDTELRTSLETEATERRKAMETHEADATKHLTAAERQKWNDKYTKAEIDNKLSALETAIDWKEAVATFADIATTYPNPEDGWTVNVKDTDYTYRYSGTQWVAISANAIPKATQTVDGLMSKEDKAKLDAASSDRHTHTNKSALDQITSALINAWNGAVSHISDAVKHITATERQLWNTVSQKAEASHNHGASDITSGTLGADRLPTVPASKGGTGQTSLANSANALINALSTGASTPVDNDYYIVQYCNGGETTKTYHRKPMRLIWEYIKAKADSIYAAKSHGTHVAYSTAAPKAPGTTSAGSADEVSRADHIHPLQTSVSGNAGSATKWATVRNINGMSVDGSANRTNYGTCSTAAATAAKAVACAGFALVVGAEIAVKFTVTNTAASPTLNVNSTGAKPIYYRGAAIGAGYLAANRTYAFRYNGVQYDLVGDINTDTNTTYGNMKGATESAAGTAGLAPAPAAGAANRYLRSDGTWQVPPNTNTWRGIQDNLTSTATDQSLSAYQGKLLKEMVDKKAPASHTHNYLPTGGLTWGQLKGV